MLIRFNDSKRGIRSRRITGGNAGGIAGVRSSDNSSMEAKFNPALRRGAVASLLCLCALCILWELWLAPVRPGGSLLALKAVPLLLPLRGVVRGNLYTMQWASMLILLYLMEGAVRAWSDPMPLSAALAGVEVVLSLAFFLCAILYVHPAKRAAKARALERR